MKINHRFWWVIIFLWFSPFAIANPKVMEDYHYYTIEPKNSDDLPAVLDRTTPINENGAIFHAHTHWEVRWTFQFWTLASGVCAVQHVNTTVTVDYTLPQLANTVKDPAVLTRFEHYFLALREHERGHAKNGMDAASEVETSLQGMSGASCEAVETLANAKGQQILQHYNQLDNDYNQQTPQGVTQGAVP